MTCLRTLRLSAAVLIGAATWLAHDQARALSTPGAICTATPTATAFGAYDPNSPSAATTTATITVGCQGPVALTLPFTVGLSAGVSGKVGARTMTSGGSVLNYEIYTSNAYSTVWGDGTSGSSTVSGLVNITLLNINTTTTFTAYGLIPAGQLASPGSYTDTVIVTVNY